MKLVCWEITYLIIANKNTPKLIITEGIIAEKARSLNNIK